MANAMATHDTNIDGRLQPSELAALLRSTPLMRLANSSAMSLEQAEEKLAEVTDELLRQFDSGRDNTIDWSELPRLWRERAEYVELAGLGLHPFYFDSLWSTYFFGMAVATIGLVVGGWGEPDDQL